MDSWEPDLKQPDTFGEMVVAAQQVLRPIKKVVEVWRHQMPEALWEQLAPLVFSTEELAGKRGQ